MAIGKVAALITRVGARGPEICLFEHVVGPTVQIPAGTLRRGEDPMTGAAREAYEETGLDGLRVVSHVATVRAPEAGADVERAVVHLVVEAPAPEEWWVFTPDGDGVCWRCHWAPIAEATAHPRQQAWLDVAREHLATVRHPGAIPRSARDEGASGRAHEIFFAPPWGAGHALMSWMDAVDGPDDASVHRSEAVCIADDGALVGVKEFGLVSLPGGRREENESLVEALRREVREEACAEVVDHELLGYQRFAWIRNDRVDAVTIDALYWARVTLQPFVPEHENCERVLMSLAEARTRPMWQSPVTRLLLDRAFAAEERRPPTAGAT